MMRNLLILCGFATVAVAQTAVATSTITRDYSFPPVGLASSESAQVNVVNLATMPTVASATAPTCTGTIAFANAGGKAIGSPVSYTTTGSQVFSTQLTFSQLGATGTRGEFVASVQTTGSFLLSRGSCVLGFSLETFDESTGVTHVYLGSSTATSALPTGPFVPAEGR
jgi:hypothetical protein